MSQDRIVGGVFAMVRIESPKCPTDAGACGNHAAVDVQSQSTQPLCFNGLINDLTIDLHQSLKRLVSKALQPPGHASLPRQTHQTAEPLHQGIFTDVTEMFQSSTTAQNQTHDH